MRRRSFEEHVLEEMAHAGRAGDLVAAPDVIPDPERNDGRVMRFERMDHEPVVEAARQWDVDVWDMKSLAVEGLATLAGWFAASTFTARTPPLTTVRRAR